MIYVSKSYEIKQIIKIQVQTENKIVLIKKTMK